MPKLLVQIEKRELVDGRERLITPKREYLVRDTAKDFHVKEGVIKAADLKKPSGSTVSTHTGASFVLLEPSFADLFKRLRKFAQTPPLKDLALIAAETGMSRDTVVLDAGAGSGHMAVFFGRLCRKVITCDIREESLAMAKENVSQMGMKNVVVKEHDIYSGSPVRSVDVVTLDVPEPWNALNCVDALKINGYLVSYLPSTIQVRNFVEAVKEDGRLQVLKTVEVIERPWKVQHDAVRPQNTPIGHSAFLTFTRRLR